MRTCIWGDFSKNCGPSKPQIWSGWRIWRALYWDNPWRSIPWWGHGLKICMFANIYISCDMHGYATIQLLTMNHKLKDYPTCDWTTLTKALRICWNLLYCNVVSFWVCPFRQLRYHRSLTFPTGSHHWIYESITKQQLAISKMNEPAGLNLYLLLLLSLRCFFILWRMGRSQIYKKLSGWWFHLQIYVVTIGILLGCTYNVIL